MITHPVASNLTIKVLVATRLKTNGHIHQTSTFNNEALASFVHMYMHVRVHENQRKSTYTVRVEAELHKIIVHTKNQACMQNLHVVAVIAAMGMFNFYVQHVWTILPSSQIPNVHALPLLCQFLCALA